MTKKYDFIKGDDKIYFTPEFTRTMYFQTCRIIADANFKFLPLDEQHMWLKKQARNGKGISKDFALRFIELLYSKKAVVSATALF